MSVEQREGYTIWKYNIFDLTKYIKISSANLYFKFKS